MKHLVCGSYIPANGLTEAQLRAIDFGKITHVFVAFSVLEKQADTDFYVPVVSEGVADGIRLLQQEIKRQNANCRVVLSIGGAFADFFCPAVRTGENRRTFAEACAALCEDYSLDGIDLDWEFPGIPHCGVMACEHCVHDFTLLCRVLRETLGEKLLTSAMGSDHWNRLENDELRGLLDYVNVMTYDMADTDHSAMTLTQNAMEGWLAQGYRPEQLLLGVPFYGRSTDESYNWMGYHTAMEAVRAGKAQRLHTDNQDYIVFADGAKLGLDFPESIHKKVRYIQQKGFGGIFCWQELTDRDGELRRAMAALLDA